MRGSSRRDEGVVWGTFLILVCGGQKVNGWTAGGRVRLTRSAPTSNDTGRVVASGNKVPQSRYGELSGASLGKTLLSSSRIITP
ncbi:hypothetical protein Pmani_024954 [Petrolisthes manimaculis]|uniref:Uncharacterized protein n=1 Tax=Petrolisthes manimaculis TaxID=1843537 RepID=A0AAE1P752_9EUCA|nr:hypothetical protein Pmani_024954 [Petrolisthes manimaculis]